MANFYVKFSRVIKVPKYEVLTSISYDTQKIYATSQEGSIIYSISNSGTVLSETTTTTNIEFLAYDNSTNNFYGYSPNAPTLLTVYNKTFHLLSTVTLGYDVTKFVPLLSLAYNVSWDTINLTYGKNVNTVNPVGDVVNNNFLKKSSYTASIISGAYMYQGVYNNKINYFVKTDLSGNLLEYYHTPKNMRIQGFSVISATEFRTTLYCIGLFQTANYLLEVCFANSPPSSPSNTYYTSTGQPLTSSPIGYRDNNSFLYNPYNYGVAPTYPPGYAINPTNVYNPVNYAGLPPSTSGSTGSSYATNPSYLTPSIPIIPLEPTNSYRRCPITTSFGTFLSTLLCYNNSGDNCQNFDLMMMILGLVYVFQCKNKKKPVNVGKEICCPNPCDAAFYQNINDLNITNNLDRTYGYYYNGTNPVT